MNHLLSLCFLMNLIPSFFFLHAISEEKLLSLIHEHEAEIPVLNSLSSSEMRSSASEKRWQDSYNTTLNSSLMTGKTGENSFITSQPVYDETSSFNVGMQKKLGLGTSLSAMVEAQKKHYESAGGEHSRTTTIGKVAIEIDLWKNFLGRFDESKSEFYRLSKEIAKDESVLEKRSFINQMRGIYWNLVAKEHAINIATKQFELAKEQEADARLRHKNSVADLGELARYGAQTAMRESTVNFLLYERENLVNEIKKNLPFLTDDDLDVAGIGIAQTEQEVLTCLKIISAQETPEQNSSTWNLIALNVENLSKQNQYLLKSYAMPDISLQLQGSSKNTQDTFAKSYDDHFKRDYGGYQAGVFVNIPLGRRNTVGDDVAADKLSTHAKVTRIKSDLVMMHEFTQKAHVLLIRALSGQQRGSKNLELRVSEMQKKFKQGRITVGELMMDQDSFLNGELNLINTKSTVIGVILKYLTVFDGTKCSFNRI